MGFFYDRDETKDKIIITLKRAALFYYFMWPCIVIWTVTLLHGGIFIILAILSFAVMLVLAVPFWGINTELKQMMKKGGIKASGSKYSFRDPLRYEIEKEI